MRLAIVQNKFQQTNKAEINHINVNHIKFEVYLHFLVDLAYCEPAGITYIHSTHKYRKAGYSVVDRAKNGPFFHALLCLAFTIYCSRKDFALLLRTYRERSLNKKVNGIVATQLCPHDTLV